MFLVVECHFLGSGAQLVVLEPPDVVAAFPEGRIEGSTAAFGAPYYGKRLIGQLIFFDTTGCKDNDYHFVSTGANPFLQGVSSSPPPANASVASSSRETGETTTEGPTSLNATLSGEGGRPIQQEELHTVVMVNRGGCNFVTKVRVAEKKGATAVIIADTEGSMSTAKDVKKVIMADDGWGDGIIIPSLLIGDVDGALLKEELRKDGKGVLVELAWNVPKAATVRMDQWISPAFSDINQFLTEFAPYAKQLQHKLNYHPHYVVIAMGPNFKEMCTDESARFCGFDPDKGGKTTGKEIIEESVRQLCLWEMSQKLDESNPNSGFYSEAWWSYIEQFTRECPIKGDSKEREAAAEALGLTQEEFELSHTLGEICSYNLMEKVGADVSQVKKCYTHNFDSLLTHELLNRAWSSTAVMINNWRYSGPLDPEQLTRTLCSAFTDVPPECTQLFHPSRSELLKDGLIVEKVEGIPLWAVVITSCFAVFLGIILALTVYWYCIHPKVRSNLRYAIMDEVRKEGSNVSYDTQPDIEQQPRGGAGSGAGGRNILCLPVTPGCSPTPSPVAGSGTASDSRTLAAPVGRQFNYRLEEDGKEGFQQTGEGGGKPDLFLEGY